MATQHRRCDNLGANLPGIMKRHVLIATGSVAFAGFFLNL
jgi:hypothetical protein